MKIVILNQFDYQTYPLSEIIFEEKEIDTPDGKVIITVQSEKSLPNIIEVDDSILTEIRKTKCFDIKNHCIIDYTPPIDHSQEIAELIKKLDDTDYLAIKHSEGRLTDAEYQPISDQRQAWRDEINRLEQEQK